MTVKRKGGGGSERAANRDKETGWPSYHLRLSQPVWPSGKALGWQAEGPRFVSASDLFSLQKPLVICGHRLVT